MTRRILAALLFPLLAHANALKNPGFEQQAEGWIISEKVPMSSVQADAAHDGGMGLRVRDEDGELGSGVGSEPVPVEPGAEITVSFFARTETPGFAGVYLWFHDGSGKLIKEEALRAGAGHPVVGVKTADGQWNPYRLTARAPETAATVSVWIHSFGKPTGTADFDDFVLEGTKNDTAASTEKSSPAPVANLPARAKPPVIIIKADDLRQIDGKVHGLWNKFADYLKARNIKASIGMLTDTLGAATPDYIRWIKERQAAGDIEFWFHGWDHAVHEEGGQKVNEFVSRSFEDQKKRFDDSQVLAQEKLGFSFAAFGPPGGAGGSSFDTNTVRVMAEDPHMKVWLYPQPLDEAGRLLQAGGKVIVLDRVWAVNLESKVGQPDFEKFLAGYTKNPDREYFVLQGHPMHWGDPAKFAEFTKIIDFLIEQKAVFMTPSEFAALQATKS